MRLNQCVRLGLSVVAILCLPVARSAAQTLATGDSRTVTEPVIPPTCTTLAAQLTMSSGAPSSETAFDTSRLQSALNACGSGKAVELVVSGTNNAFLIQPITLPAGTGLIVDGGVTVFASRNPTDYQTKSTELCGTYGSSGNGCNNLISTSGSGSGIYGYGIIDARGGSPMLGGPNPGISWWTNADNANTNNASQDNPILLKTNAGNFTLYKITLRNSPMFHVGWSGTGFTAWGVKIQAPYTAHNTDGIDPTGTNVTITNASISDGDDNVAVGASSASANVTVSNVNTYSGHGISVGSYTQGGLNNFLVTNVNMAGTPQDGNANGIRLKSAQDRGGVVQNVTYQNMCIRDTRYPLQFNPFYNTNTGTLVPTFSNIVLSNVHVLSPTTGQYPYQVQLQGHDSTHPTTFTMQNVVFDSLSSNQLSPAPSYDTITIAGNVYPALLTTISGTGVTTSGSATSTAGTGVSACTGVFPYVVGELYGQTSTATNLKTAVVGKTQSITLNAMVMPAMSQTAFSGTSGSWAGAAALSQPVSFLEGTNSVGTATISGNGTLASLTLSNLTPGTHTYTASYPGDSNYSALAFGSITVTVTNATTASTTTLTAPATGTFGTAISLSATVAGSGGTPTGTVAFLDGGVNIGSGTLSGGVATFAASLTGGAHTITAVYSGDNTFVTSTSSASTVTVAQVASTTALVANPTDVSAGLTSTLTATITGLSGQAKPTGSVAFADGSTALGTATVNSSGVATLAATLTNTGARTITASYSGDASYMASSGTAQVNVTSATTATALTSPTAGVYGVGLAMSAKVTSGASGTPTGSVTFYDGTNAIATANLTSAAGSISGVVLSGGTHSITAVYSGDSTFPASTSAATTLVISTATSSTSLSISPSSTAALSPVSLTATVNGVATGVTPTGNVTFSDGSTVLGVGTLTGNTATLSVGLPNAGARTITAAYAGDTNYAASMGTSSETVTALTTTTTLSLSTASAYGGQAVTLTATVSPATLGTVTFYVNANSVGTGTVSGSGVATYVYTLPATSVGSYAVTANYAAGGAYAASTSAEKTLMVATAFTLSLGSSSVSIAKGASGTATLNITPGGGFTGTVGVSCSTPVTYITCSVANANAAVTGTTAVSDMITINVASTLSRVVAPKFGGRFVVYAILAPFSLIGLAFATRRKRSLLARVTVAAVVLVGGLVVTSLSGCSSSAPAAASTTSSAVSQQVTITATAAGLTQTTQVQVNIQ